VTVVLDGADAAGVPVTFEITGNPSNGALGPVNQANGTVTYTPDAGYAGTDSFTFVVNSPNGASNNATASIAINPAGVGGGQPPPQGPTAGPAATGTGTPPAPFGQGVPTLPPGSSSSSPPAPRAAPPAELRGPPSCVSRRFRARVTGQGIAQVRFFLDGKWRRTITAKAGQTVFTLFTSPRSGVHHITAKVRFARAGTKIRTLRMLYQRCSTATASPKFAG
jgi:hypothetical protein